MWTTDTVVLAAQKPRALSHLRHATVILKNRPVSRKMFSCPHTGQLTRRRPPPAEVPDISDRTLAVSFRMGRRCTVIVNISFAIHQLQDGMCGQLVTSHVLVHKAVPVGSSAQYDIEHVCSDHLCDYRHLIDAGRVTVLTAEEALVAEVMLS